MKQGNVGRNCSNRFLVQPDPASAAGNFNSRLAINIIFVYNALEETLVRVEGDQLFQSGGTEGGEMAQKVKPLHQVGLALAVVTGDQIYSGGKGEE